ncbi:hypothetical protein BGAL_0124g00050 [Botrytis galanthina]|uniref:Uncharacterized protein n=1 Tax=Botrytis galanthina TaxID=278940 RepID=A0A4S8R4K4_9HELO|nr:hypothetical protein BGAL_0124g00050 [Botrytis galanthina]
MVNFKVIGPDVAAPGNQWPIPPPTAGLVTSLNKTEEGATLYFLPGTYLFVPTGTGRNYRPIEVNGVAPMMWNHHTREVLMGESLSHLYGTPLADCLTVSTEPDEGYEEREAAARELAERRAASRRETNRRALERARARQAAAQAAAQAVVEAPLAPVSPAAVSPLAPASPAPASPDAAPLAAAPLVPVPVVAAPVAPAPVAAALGVPALVAPAGDAPESHDAPVVGSRAFWDQFIASDVTEQWWQEEDEAMGQVIPIIILE